MKLELIYEEATQTSICVRDKEVIFHFAASYRNYRNPPKFTPVLNLLDKDENTDIDRTCAR